MKPMTPNKQLGELGSQSFGFSFRGAISPREDGDLLVVQAKNIFADSEIDKLAQLARTDSSLVGNAMRLKKGDVLLTTRSVGRGGFKASVCGDVDQNTIASSSICIIRITDSGMLPQYLALYLNSAAGQVAISRSSFGSVVHALHLRHIRNLEIPIPELETQRHLMGLLQSTRLHEHLLERKKELFQAIDRYATNQIIESITL